MSTRDNLAGAARRRGLILAYFIFLLPAAAALIVILLTRLEAALVAAERDIAHTQARLLAESALAVHRATGDATEGRIDGAGAYTLAPEGEGIWTATGRVEDPHGKTIVRLSLRTEPNDALTPLAFEADYQAAPPEKE